MNKSSVVYLLLLLTRTELIHLNKKKEQLPVSIHINVLQGNNSKMIIYWLLFQLLPNNLNHHA